MTSAQAEAPVDDPRSGGRVIIFDTTLRDGEQSPGASMTLDEKLAIAAQLETMGVDVIEAGFAIASEGDFEAVRAVARQSKTSIIASLARATEADIRRAWDAVQYAPRPRIHTFIATSPLHMKHKLNMRENAVIERIHESVSLARSLCDDVEWSAEDATRSDLEFLVRAVETAIRAGATTINLPDTVGYALPHEYAQMFTHVLERVPDADKAVFSTHCHNDLGLAVANSLAAVASGARQVECTINGIGERAGNAAMEEIVMAVRTRANALNLTTAIDTTEITAASRLVSATTGFSVQNNKAIVGANAFAHESGIHQDGVLKHAETYEIMTPESVGLTRSTLVMGKHSGRHAFQAKVAELGYHLEADDREAAFHRFKALADQKKEIYDEDIVALIDDEIIRDEEPIRLISLKIRCGTDGPQTAHLRLSVDGEEREIETSGNGPVDAIFEAIKSIAVPSRPHLQLFQVHAVTEGTDAQAKVTVRLEENGKTANGQGAHPDTLVAAARAYINAANKLSIKRRRTAPDAIGA
ncbi:MAG: 2-isopropylmalate synthase [Pseudomonadota bacterium]